MDHQMEKENMYLHQRVKKYRVQTESLLTQMKRRMNTPKTLSFLKEENQRETDTVDTFFEMMGALFQQPHPRSYVTRHPFYV